MGNRQLPFGQTPVSAEGLSQAVDIDRAARILGKHGVVDAEDRIESFVDNVPSLLCWLEENGREYPWIYTTDPWRVYISEILLQRTRGDAVAKIYPEFFEWFPDPESLHKTDDSEIFDLVSSLGFGNQRTRTLQEVAEMCHHDHCGTVPHDLEELKRPWRVRPYSARACLVFAFGESLALVDSNIARIIERIIHCNMSSQPHKSDRMYGLMECLAPDEPDVARAFNFALIDLGAIVCTTPRPECNLCPLNNYCTYLEKRSSKD